MIVQHLILMSSNFLQVFIFLLLFGNFKYFDEQDFITPTTVLYMVSKHEFRLALFLSLVRQWLWAHDVLRQLSNQLASNNDLPRPLFIPHNILLHIVRTKLLMIVNNLFAMSLKLFTKKCRNNHATLSNTNGPVQFVTSIIAHTPFVSRVRLISNVGATSTYTLYHTSRIQLTYVQQTQSSDLQSSPTKYKYPHCLENCTTTIINSNLSIIVHISKLWTS